MDDFYESQTIDSATAQNFYVLNWNVINNDRLASPVTCRNLLDHVTLPLYWFALPQSHDATFSWMLRVSDPGRQRFCREVGELAKFGTEILVCGKRCAGAAFLELEEGSLGHVPPLSCIPNPHSVDVCPLWVRHVALAQLEAYDPEVEGKYVAAVFEFENISFPLLDELESLKDSSFASIMSALVLKDDQGNVDGTPEFACFQPSLDQVVVPVYSDSGPVDHEMLLSEAIPSVRRSRKKKMCPLVDWDLSALFPPPVHHLMSADYQVFV
ncbi:hypothetical protein Tco_0590506 [Tanacetum coccineum]